MSHKHEHVSTGNGFWVDNNGTRTQVINQAGEIKANIKDALASGKIYVGNASGISAEVAVSGDATLANTGALTLGAAAVTGKLITGFVSGAGTVAATDTILEALNKLDGNVVALEATEAGGALADGNILVGSAGGVSAGVAMSGDVTIVNTGATTVASLDLETATVTNIADTEIMIGDGAGSAAFAALSGDATMANTGAVTVNGSTGAFSVGTTFTTGSTTATSGADAVAITGSIHEVTTTGTGDALTLADGAEGQHLHVVYVAEGAGSDTAVLTPSNLAGANTTVTFTDLGDSAHLLFTAGAWYFLGGEATVA